MKRPTQRGDAQMPPEHLTRFEPDRWGEGEVGTRLARWWVARRQWRNGHGGTWPLKVAGRTEELLWAHTARSMRRWLGGPDDPPNPYDPPDEFRQAQRAAKAKADAQDEASSC